jgi:hypothetical protein
MKKFVLQRHANGGLRIDCCGGPARNFSMPQGGGYELEEALRQMQLGHKLELTFVDESATGEKKP